MRFKIKKLRLGAGRPVVFIHQKTAQELNIHVDQRVQVSYRDAKIIAVVDVVKGMIRADEVSLSDEIFDYLKVKAGDLVDITLALEPRSDRYIIKKLNGETLSKAEIYSIVRDIVNNALTEAEIAYFVSGVYDNGLDTRETIYLTDAIYKTGERLNLRSKNIVDKHSIGGIAGNRTTPIVVAICAASGLTMPKTSSRAITSPAGTADVIETLAHVDFSAKELRKIMDKTGACLAWGGSLGFAPADDKLIRVERLLGLDPESQLIASILAKKLSVGSKYVLIDIPYGPHAKVTKQRAENLKKKFLKVGKYFKLRLKIVLTDGNQPIGNGIGPNLEMSDVIRVLKRDGPPQDLEKKAVFLSGQILEMTGKAKKGAGEALAREILCSGKALKKFNEIIDAQGRKKADLNPAKFKRDIMAERPGIIKSINNKSIQNLGRILGCPIDKAAGIYLHVHNGYKVAPGAVLMTFYSESRKKLKEGMDYYNESKPVEIK